MDTSGVKFANLTISLAIGNLTWRSIVTLDEKLPKQSSEIREYIKQSVLILVNEHFKITNRPKNC